MSVLILSCNTGGGHNSCAQAIEDVFEANGEPCTRADALSFISEHVSRFMSWGHVTMYRKMPWLFRFGYGWSEEHPGAFREGTSMYDLLAKGTGELRQFIREGQFDQVICVHIFAGIMLTAMLKEEPMDIRTAFMATDYTASPGIESIDLPRYFIPSEQLVEEFTDHGVPKDRIICSGIAVRQMFYQHTPGAEARAALGMDPRHRHILMMCGSMGCGPMEELSKKLGEALPADCELSIICGTNDSLREHLEEKCRKKPNLHVIGFVKDMAQLMDSADFCLMKPGGLSTSEAAVKGLPMVLINAVAGCETHNLQFYLKNGGARTGETVEELTDCCLQLLAHPEELAQMREALKDAVPGNAAQTIYETLREAAVCNF